MRICTITDRSQATANGVLIAAAPELAEMLVRCCGMFQQSPLNADGDWINSRLARDMAALLARINGGAE